MKLPEKWEHFTVLDMRPRPFVLMRPENTAPLFERQRLYDLWVWHNKKRAVVEATTDFLLRDVYMVDERTVELATEDPNIGRGSVLWALLLLYNTYGPRARHIRALING